MEVETQLVLQEKCPLFLIFTFKETENSSKLLMKVRHAKLKKDNPTVADRRMNTAQYKPPHFFLFKLFKERPVKLRATF
jgi:hypothetical protein